MAETVRCTQCGHANAVEARFCAACGTSLTQAITGPTRRLDGVVCPNCGTANLQQAEFCTSCGQSLVRAPSAESQPYTRTRAPHRQGVGSMQCPVCREVALVMTDRQGIEVDYCPSCRGVWLDRGELDKIIERVAQPQGQAPRQSTHAPHYDSRDDDDRYRRTKKRRHLLDDLFDFD